MKKNLKGMLPMIKFTMILFMFQLIISLFSIILLGIAVEKFALTLILGFAFLVCSGTFLFFIASSTAVTDFNCKKNNALRLKNNEKVESYKLLQEYRWWKGYLAAFLSVLPLIILVICDAVFSGVWAGAAVKLIYSIYYVPIFTMFPKFTESWPLLYAVLIVVGVAGGSYHLKAKKLEYQQLVLTHQI